MTAERFGEVEARLKSRGIDYIGPIAQLPGLLGIYFDDPNGIRLEFACQPEDGETPAVISRVTQTKAEARKRTRDITGRHVRLDRSAPRRAATLTGASMQSR